jgi:hypothetical protein
MMIGTTDAHPFVLSDCGAVAFSLDVDAVPDDSKRLLLIPINSRVLLVYGHCDVLPCLQMVPLVQINALLFAYAARSAFCASREGLETVSEYVGTPNPQANPEWQAWARLPSFNQAARAQGASMPVLWLSYPIRAQTET